MNPKPILFIFPPSPFQEEKDRLGQGFLASQDPDSPSRSKPGAGEKPRKLGGRRRTKHFSPEERRAIGATTGPRTPVAARYGTTEDYVSTLRRKYRKGEL